MRTGCSSTHTAPSVAATRARRWLRRSAARGLQTAVRARPPHRTAAAGAQRELTHSQNELQLGGRLVLAPFEALNTKSCVVSLRRASGAAGFTDTRWVELEELYDNCGKQNLNRALKAYRTAEKKAADEAIVGFEEDDE